MTPEQKVKLLILIRHSELTDTPLADITAENIDAIYDSTEDLYDAINEVRSCHIETDVPIPYSRASRYYESKSVAAQLPDGSWVGWTYWYGGGKHGEPEAVNWIDEAYDLSVSEEEKLVVVRTFKRI